MTEVPEHLLQRSRERRAALGLSTGDEGGEAKPAAPAKAEAAEEQPAAATPAPAAPAAPPAPAPEPEPVPAVVVAAQSRPRIPVWALSVLAVLPLWAIVYVGVLTEHEETVGVLALGEELFVANCAACHGATGGGGVAPALADPQLLETFPDFDEQLTFVAEGSVAGEPYGAAGDVGTGAMPGFGGQLSEEELRAVVIYERFLAGEEPPEEDELDETAEGAGGEGAGGEGGQ